MTVDNKTPQATAGAGGAGTPAAGSAGAGGNGGSSNPQTPVPQPNSFLDGLSEDLRGYAELKGFKDSASVLNAYKNLEKFQGVPADKLLKLPDENDKEAVNAFLEKLGRPKTAEEYKIAIPEGQSDKLAKAMAPLFFNAGLSQKQVEQLVAGWNSLQQAEAKAIQQQQAEFIAAQEAELKAEWGGRYNENLELAKRAAISLGITAEQINAIEKSTDFKTTMNLLLNIAGKLSEDSLKGAGNAGGNGVLTPAAAKAKLAQLEQDPEWAKKFNNKDSAAIEEFKRLQLIAAGIPTK